jgi:hypothetical protein
MVKVIEKENRKLTSFLLNFCEEQARKRLRHLSCKNNVYKHTFGRKVTTESVKFSEVPWYLWEFGSLQQKTKTSVYQSIDQLHIQICHPSTLSLQRLSTSFDSFFDLLFYIFLASILHPQTPPRPPRKKAPRHTLVSINQICFIKQW